MSWRDSYTVAHWGHNHQYPLVIEADHALFAEKMIEAVYEMEESERDTELDFERNAVPGSHKSSAIVFKSIPGSKQPDMKAMMKRYEERKVKQTPLSSVPAGSKLLELFDKSTSECSRVATYNVLLKSVETSSSTKKSTTIYCTHIRRWQLVANAIDKMFVYVQTRHVPDSGTSRVRIEWLPVMVQRVLRCIHLHFASRKVLMNCDQLIRFGARGGIFLDPYGTDGPRDPRDIAIREILPTSQTAISCAIYLVGCNKIAQYDLRKEFFDGLLWEFANGVFGTGEWNTADVLLDKLSRNPALRKACQSSIDTFRSVDGDMEATVHSLRQQIAGHSIISAEFLNGFRFGQALQSTTDNKVTHPIVKPSDRYWTHAQFSVITYTEYMKHLIMHRHFRTALMHVEQKRGMVYLIVNAPMGDVCVSLKRTIDLRREQYQADPIYTRYDHSSPSSSDTPSTIIAMEMRHWYVYSIYTSIYYTQPRRPPVSSKTVVSSSSSSSSLSSLSSRPTPSPTITTPVFNGESRANAESKLCNEKWKRLSFVPIIMQMLYHSDVFVKNTAFNILRDFAGIQTSNTDNRLDANDEDYAKRVDRFVAITERLATDRSICESLLNATRTDSSSRDLSLLPRLLVQLLKPLLAISPKDQLRFGYGDAEVSKWEPIPSGVDPSESRNILESWKSKQYLSALHVAVDHVEARASPIHAIQTNLFSNSTGYDAWDDLAKLAITTSDYKQLSGVLRGCSYRRLGPKHEGDGTSECEGMYDMEHINTQRRETKQADMGPVNCSSFCIRNGNSASILASFVMGLEMSNYDITWTPSMHHWLYEPFIHKHGSVSSSPLLPASSLTLAFSSSSSSSSSLSSLLYHGNACETSRCIRTSLYPFGMVHGANGTTYLHPTDRFFIWPGVVTPELQVGHRWMSFDWYFTRQCTPLMYKGINDVIQAYQSIRRKRPQDANTDDTKTIATTVGFGDSDDAKEQNNYDPKRVKITVSDPRLVRIISSSSSSSSSSIPSFTSKLFQPSTVHTFAVSV